jgi:hypothetical protein
VSVQVCNGTQMGLAGLVQAPEEVSILYGYLTTGGLRYLENLTHGVSSCELPADESDPKVVCVVALSNIDSGRRIGIGRQIPR